MAQREKNLDAMQPALQQIQSSADRVSHLITQLLALARSEPIAGNHELKQIDLRLLVQNVCIEWVPKALQKQIELSFDAPHQQAIWIRGNTLLLAEMLGNLIDNAIAYGQTAGKIVVKLNAEPQPCLRVEDNACGIPDSEQERIFERFYRISGSPGDGCGLGLAIVKEIADLHQAQIQLSNQPNGQGTVMSVTFST